MSRKASNSAVPRSRERIVLVVSRAAITPSRPPKWWYTELRATPDFSITRSKLNFTKPNSAISASAAFNTRSIVRKPSERLRRVGEIPDVSESSCVITVRLTIYMRAVAGATNDAIWTRSTVGYPLKGEHGPGGIHVNY